MIESLVDFWLAVRGLMWVLVALSAITLLAFVLDASGQSDEHTPRKW